jgi:hypothetical protein
MGGVFVPHDTVLEPGTRLTAELELDDGDLCVSATVRWVRHHSVTRLSPCGCGLAFDSLTPTDAARLTSAITRAAR